MKLAFYLILMVLLLLAYLQIRLSPKAESLPNFMTKDVIADAVTKSKINIVTRSPIIPPQASLNQLASDYSKIWAHLNHLYETNDITIGKEFYTEEWFKFLSKNHTTLTQSLLSRQDLQHNLIIHNWSNDNLICMATDSAVLLNYHMQGRRIKSELINVSVVLLFQGDNWRLDAIKVNDNKIVNP
ncbi:hypothetical protein [Sphingobacterium sp.]|uniref:hypothetical protein n=1 Tax=Sphingobacterium sp. TaxID=341027 RepID=UPI0031D56938